MFINQLLFALRHKLCEEAGSEGSKGGGGGEDPPGDDPKNKPSDREAELLRETMQRKEKIKELQTKLDALKDIDPTRYRELVSAESKRKEEEATKEREDAERRGEFDRVKAQMNQLHEAKLGELNTKIAELEKQLNVKGSEVNSLTLNTVFGESNFLKKETDLSVATARQIFGGYFEIKDGAVVGYNKPAGASERTMLVDGKGNPVDFDTAFAQVFGGHPDKDLFAKSKLQRGSNGRQNEVKKTDGDQHATGVDRIAAALKAASAKK